MEIAKLRRMQSKKKSIKKTLDPAKRPNSEEDQQLFAWFLHFPDASGEEERRKEKGRKKATLKEA